MKLMKTKILIVEDECLIAGDIQEILEDYGYTVTGIATTGEEALVYVSKTNPDLILMDIKLDGEMDGTEAADIINRIYNIPIIFITAYADREILEKAKAAEPFGYIVKPFDEKKLHPAIQMALHKSSCDKKLKEEVKSYRNLKEKNRVEIIFKIERNGESNNADDVEITGTILEKLLKSRQKEVIQSSPDLQDIECQEENNITTRDSSKMNTGNFVKLTSEKYKPKFGMKAVSKKTGIENNLIRHYEKQGLIKPYRDPENNYRIFTGDEVEWLIRIKKLINEIGFNIQGIRVLLTLHPCWEASNCPDKIRDTCNVFNKKSMPCWFYDCELECCLEKECYHCEYYIKARQHYKLKV